MLWPWSGNSFVKLGALEIFFIKRLGLQRHQLKWAHCKLPTSVRLNLESCKSKREFWYSWKFMMSMSKRVFTSFFFPNLQFQQKILSVSFWIWIEFASRESNWNARTCRLRLRQRWSYKQNITLTESEHIWLCLKFSGVLFTIQAVTIFNFKPIIN